MTTGPVAMTQPAAPGNGASSSAPAADSQAPDQLRRIGLLGGAFDPPHRAHQALAHAAIEQLQLDELRLLPTGDAWHKARTLTPAEHRLAMARLAFAALPQAVVDDRELRRGGPTYTVDTLRELAAEHPGTTLLLVVGADQALAFDRWREPEAITRLATICVARRPPDESVDVQPAAPSAAPSYPIPGGHWLALDMAPIPLSATAIRQRLEKGQGADELLDPAVARYIAQHHLYATSR